MQEKKIYFPRHKPSLHNFLNLSIILLTLIKQYSTYNFAGKQNFEIDQIYGQIPGFQSYTYSNQNKTLIIFDVYPDSILTFNFKIYSNDTAIKSLYEDKFRGFYIGFDFLYSKQKEYKPNSMICYLNVNASLCLDYFYAPKDEKYYKNQVQDTNGYLVASKK